MRAIARALTVLLLLSAWPAAFAEADLRSLLAALGNGGFDETEQAVQALAHTGDARVAPALQELAEGNLYVRESDGAVVIGRKGTGRTLVLTDALTGEALG